MPAVGTRLADVMATNKPKALDNPCPKVADDYADSIIATIKRAAEEGTYPFDLKPAQSCDVYYAEQIVDQVRERYGRIADGRSSSCCAPESACCDWKVRMSDRSRLGNPCATAKRYC